VQVRSLDPSLVECLDGCLSLVNNLAAPGFDSADYELISSASRQLYVSVSEASTQRFAELSLKVETYSLPFNSKTAADTIFVNRTGIAEARKKNERIVAKKRDYFMLVIEFQENVANVCSSATFSQYAGTQQQPNGDSRRYRVHDSTYAHGRSGCSLSPW